MIYSILADLIIVFHFLFIAFVVAGAFLVLKWHWVIYIHIPAAIWGVLIEIEQWICPLTPLEVRLRMAAGESFYEGGFIAHYLVPIIYPPGLNRAMQISLAIFVIVVNVGVYGYYVWKRIRIKSQ
ncbi:MAG TPA: DUF2784 domain-containing protein [bacterium]|nr:DUF2784 domain-containing protein [bacterium]